MKIRPVGEVLHTDGHHEANCRLSQFCEHAKKWNWLSKLCLPASL